MCFINMKGLLVPWLVLLWLATIDGLFIEEVNVDLENIIDDDAEIFNLEVGGDSVYLFSPDYPKPIKPNTRKTWILNAEQGSKVQIICSDLRLYFNSSNCGFYALRIVDGPKAFVHCGTGSGQSHLSTAEVLKVELRTGVREGGFIFCEAWASSGVTTISPEAPQFESDEIDSSEHGGPPGKKTTTCPCGWTNKESGRITGGKETGKNEYPFMAGLVYRGDRLSMCGASIITRYHALTAAHCIDGFKAEKLSIIVGEHDQRTESETDVTKEIPVAKIIPFEKYIWYVMKYDIAVLVLERPIEFSQLVGPVCLSRLQENITMEYVKNLGWGDTKYQRWEPSPVLKKVDTRVIPLSVCNKYFPSVNLKVPTHICTFSEKKASCQGDSGGPVIWLDPQTNRYTQRGIASYGKACGTIYPSVKTDVSAFIDWIEKQVKDTYPSENLCYRKDD